MSKPESKDGYPGWFVVGVFVVGFLCGMICTVMAYANAPISSSPYCIKK